MDLLSKYFKLSDVQIEKYAQLESLYSEWNQKINVISRKDIDELYLKHILHSMAIAKIIRFTKDTEVVDIGTGGGFPGIPLAILFPEVQFHLVDSIGKKIKVVNAVKEALNLENVSTQQIRSNELRGRKFDFVVSRAVTAMPKFVLETRHLVSQIDKNTLPNGIIALKGGELGAEMQSFSKKHYAIDELSKFFKEEFFQTKKVIYLQI